MQAQQGYICTYIHIPEANSARTITMGLLDTAVGRSRLASSLGGEGFARSLATGRLASSLLGPGTPFPHA